MRGIRHVSDSEACCAAPSCDFAVDYDAMERGRAHAERTAHEVVVVQRVVTVYPSERPHGGLIAPPDCS